MPCSLHGLFRSAGSGEVPHQRSGRWMSQVGVDAAKYLQQPSRCSVQAGEGEIPIAWFMRAEHVLFLRLHRCFDLRLAVLRLLVLLRVHARVGRDTVEENCCSNRARELASPPKLC